MSSTWVTIKKKNNSSGRYRNSSKPTQPTNSHSQRNQSRSNPKDSVQKNITECFNKIEKNQSLLLSESDIMNKIFVEPVCKEELEIARNMMNKTSEPDADDDWYNISEEYNICLDRRREKQNLSSIFSDTLAGPTVIKTSTKTSNIVDSILPFNIALVCEWKEEEEWKSQKICIIKTIKEFWDIVMYMNGNDHESNFAKSSADKEDLSDNIFKNLISSGKKSESDIVMIEISVQKKIKTIVSKFNNLHPVWSFVKVGPETSIDKVEVPFERRNNRAINDITVNLKDTKSNHERGVYVIDKDFSTGYIPRIITNFVCGLMPVNTSAIVFSKTIAISGNYYFKGFRLRILSSNVNSTVIENCKKYIESTFDEENCRYARCMVKITVPK